MTSAGRCPTLTDIAANSVRVGILVRLAIRRWWRLWLLFLVILWVLFLRNIVSEEAREATMNARTHGRVSVHIVEDKKILTLLKEPAEEGLGLKLSTRSAFIRIILSDSEAQEHRTPFYYTRAATTLLPAQSQSSAFINPGISGVIILYSEETLKYNICFMILMRPVVTDMAFLRLLGSVCTAQFPEEHFRMVGEAGLSTW
ncbi:hypothetical protein OBBRIDRAFT_808854 [Obba rivulosa]|uniref:Uncharacterized protein n=1 Tax=Obba rivulosa TaxID=1052685 RepID=A0A8E2AFY0_9APHY|nr:hypothetical protein OBBRIDRAFT_808854 [Obba rivulosa]